MTHPNATLLNEEITATIVIMNEAGSLFIFFFNLFQLENNQNGYGYYNDNKKNTGYHRKSARRLGRKKNAQDAHDHANDQHRIKRNQVLSLIGGHLLEVYNVAEKVEQSNTQNNVNSQSSTSLLGHWSEKKDSRQTCYINPYPDYARFVFLQVQK